jgi:hypothetical protein
MRSFWYSLHEGIEANTKATDLVDIPNFNRLAIDLKYPAKLLLTLNVPDTWSSKAGDFNSFALVVDNQVVADGVYQSAIDNQRVPISISTVKELPAGNHAIAAQWKTKEASDLWIGATGTAILSARVIV